MQLPEVFVDVDCDKPHAAAGSVLSALIATSHMQLSAAGNGRHCYGRCRRADSTAGKSLPQLRLLSTGQLHCWHKPAAATAAVDGLTRLLA